MTTTKDPAREVGLALLTLISGAGLVTMFPVVPTTLTNIFNNHLGRVAILVALLYQSGRTFRVAMVMAIVFYLFVLFLGTLDMPSTWTAPSITPAAAPAP